MDIRRFFIALGGLAVIASPVPAPADAGPIVRSDAAVVRTESGLVRGTVATDHREFLGIPYAAPPVGPLRWRAPRAAARWSGVRDATRPGPSCPQLASAGAGVTGTEDCLNLNVWTPAGGPRRTHVPVVVWIPGGGFVSGAGSRYDPTRLVTQGGVVVVTVNYRLGALGFLRSPALATEDPSAGNYGLADQQAALRWVRREIAAFGGDQHNVTVVGQSAGGFSVCAQLASPAARGLFDKAVAQSGPCGNSLLTRVEAEHRGADAAAVLGCATTACLRALPVADLVRLGADKVFTDTAPITGLPWLPVAGTAVLPEQPLEAIQDGSAARVPFVHGGTRDEMSVFVALNHGSDRPLTADQYRDAVRDLFGMDGAAVLRRYPVERYAGPGEALSRVLTDWGGKLGSCSMLPADDAMARRGAVYAYEFAEDSGVGPAQGMPFALGAPHGSDTQYLFDGTFSPTHPSTPEQLALARTMIAYVARFAATGDPNGAGLPRWPVYAQGRIRPVRGGLVGRGSVLSLASGPGAVAPVDLAREHQCAFWSTVSSPQHRRSTPVLR